MQGLEKVLCPVLIPIRTLDRHILKLPDQSHYRASFTVEVQDDWKELMQRGRTGKFIPAGSLKGEAWREIAKGRILQLAEDGTVAEGEIYTGAGKAKLEQALSTLTEQDFLEIDQYGAAAKVLSGLVECALTRMAVKCGYTVHRMPEDMARGITLYTESLVER